MDREVEFSAREAPMTRRLVLQIGTLLALAALGAGTAFAVGAPLLKSSHSAKLGSIVVNASGLTLYHLTSETKGRVQCNGVCADFWLPVLVVGKAEPKLGVGVSAAKIGTVKRPDGKVQVTYAGFPLYRYYLDKKPGQDHGEGIRYGTGVWYAVSTAGKIVKVKTAPAPTPTSQQTTTSSSGGGGMGY
jgi:predicted lipoprotein with Yx(FWY)xxD motif